MSQLKDANKRIHNLEVALLAFYTMVEPLMDDDARKRAREMFESFYGASESCGGCKQGKFKGKQS
jgi:hypothetical protein